MAGGGAGADAGLESRAEAGVGGLIRGAGEGGHGGRRCECRGGWLLGEAGRPQTWPWGARSDVVGCWRGRMATVLDLGSLEGTEACSDTKIDAGQSRGQRKKRKNSRSLTGGRRRDRRWGCRLRALPFIGTTLGWGFLSKLLPLHRREQAQFFFHSINQSTISK
ncbi:hypothetical protein Taro_033755 [Colocasia esculenta]|uniref:Uncharacterized protein n=1 Tax=Colocasia esculenta TaxID=4460 RepID=A0A843W5M5_COLES|nr:hypothetical protein [Colocasia esculenta]